MAENEDSLFRILISTDNHLGVWEKDEDRKHDSFRAFEEILQLALEKDVDMLLLGGDLFHDNKPSRSTVIRTIELLSKYCLGDRPVQFQVLSDQKQNFVSGQVNFDNPNINVGLPVFTIHGNHDDPAGQDNLSAVDLLSSCGLVNYFGKVLLSGNNIGNITLSPVLVKKGRTKLALYGLGNVRDERLGRLFQTPGCVQWLRPASTEAIGLEDWLNVFVLHQNRVQHGATAKNCLQERHLPAFMDLVVWGHEHECIPEPQALQSPDTNDDDAKAYVIQPGSSVATALSEGESKQKHVFLLEMLESQWRTIKLPLQTVRPFVWDTISLAAAQPKLDPEDSAAITAHLERKVNSMIQKALSDRPAAQQQQQQHPNQQPPPAQPPILPLIRLRVDYTGYSTINSQRFGQKFVGKVANPNDILLWAKAAQRRAKEEGRSAVEDEGAGGLGLSGLRPEQLDQARIEDLVHANLQAQLDILPPDELALALHEFVEKDEKAALANCVQQVLEETRNVARARPGADLAELSAGGEADGVTTKDDDIASVVSLCVQSRKASKLAGGTPGLGTQSAAAGGVGGGAGNPLQNSNWDPSGAPGTGGVGGGWDDMDIDGLDENRQPGAAAGGGAGRGTGMPPPAPKGRQRKGAAAGGAGGMRQAGLAEAFSRASQQQQQGLQSPQGRTGSNLDGFLGLAGQDGGSTPSQNTSRSRSTAAGGSARGGRGSRGGGRGARGGGKGSRGGRGGKRAAAAAELDSEEEFVSEEGISEDEEDERPAKKARAAPRPKRAAATNRRVSYTEDGGLDSDEDNPNHTPAPSSKTPAAAAGGRRSAAATASRGAGAAVAPSEQYSLISSDDEEVEPISEDHSLDEREQIEDASQDTFGAGSRQTGRLAGSRSRQAGGAGDGSSRKYGSQAGGGRQRGRTGSAAVAGGTQASAGTGAAGGSIDGGFVDSDDDAAATTPAAVPPHGESAPAARAAAAGGGGRRRVLPSSLGPS